MEIIFFLNHSCVRRMLCSLTKLSKNGIALRHNVREVFVRKIHLSHVQREAASPASDNSDKHEVPGTMSSRYEIFSESSSPVILDIEEERLKSQETYEHNSFDEFQGIIFERGVSGVFEIKELVDILRKEKAQDIFVAKVPSKCNYTDYLVVVTGRSDRHMLAMCEFIRKIFKKKMNKTDCLPMLEGKKSNKWMALDLGNIVLHIFSKTGREIFDLESLWSVGKEYDSHFQEKDTSTENIMTDYSNLLASLTPNTPARN